MALVGRPTPFLATSATTLLTCPAGGAFTLHALTLFNGGGASATVTLSRYIATTGQTTTRTVTLAAGADWTLPKPLDFVAGDTFSATASVANVVSVFACETVDTNPAVPVAVGFTPRGAWSSTATYAVNDVVAASNGGSYISLQAANVGNDPTSSTGYWMVNAQRGAAGTNGTNGSNGANGNTVLNGAGAPATGTGSNGDFYVDTTNNRLYGPKAAGAWPSGYLSLVGPQGAAGVGVPTGGSTGQFLRKASATNYDDYWSTLSSGDVNTALGGAAALLGSLANFTAGLQSAGNTVLTVAGGTVAALSVSSDVNVGGTLGLGSQTLGTSAGSLATRVVLTENSGNSDQLKVQWKRQSAGSDWQSTFVELRRDIDGTGGQGFVRLGDPRNFVQGVQLGVGDNNVLSVANGNVSVSGALSVSGPLQLASYTVATVPSASANPRAEIYVSNESGGAVTAFSDGSNWRRVTDRAVIS